MGQVVECRVIFGGDGTRVIVLVEGKEKIGVVPLVAILKQQVAELIAEHEKQTGERI